MVFHIYIWPYKVPLLITLTIEPPITLWEGSQIFLDINMESVLRSKPNLAPLKRRYPCSPSMLSVSFMIPSFIYIYIYIKDGMSYGQKLVMVMKPTFMWLFCIANPSKMIPHVASLPWQKLYMVIKQLLLGKALWNINHWTIHEVF